MGVGVARSLGKGEMSSLTNIGFQFCEIKNSGDLLHNNVKCKCSLCVFYITIEYFQILMHPL